MNAARGGSDGEVEIDRLQGRHRGGASGVADV